MRFRRSLITVTAVIVGWVSACFFAGCSNSLTGFTDGHSEPAPTEIPTVIPPIRVPLRFAHTTTQVIGESCTSPYSEFCAPGLSLPVTTAGLLRARYRVTGDCSSVRIHFSVDGVPGPVSDFVGWPGATGAFASLPLDTGFVDLGPQMPGSHLLGVELEGQLGGCNVVAVYSWGAMLDITTD